MGGAGAAVIKMIYIILTLVSGILLSGVWFGLNFLIQICVEKSKVKFLERYSVIAASFLFSMRAGLLLLKSGFIGLHMEGHFLERILSTIIRKIRR